MLSTTQLQLHIGPRLLLEKLDWQVAPGECWCVIGRNGAGKSSLLRTLAGLQPVQRGQLAIAGRNLAEWPLLELARQRSFLAQTRSDPFGYSALESVLSARHPWSSQQYWEAEADREIAMQALAALEVQELAVRDVRSLSGGERQRVAIAALLAQDAPLMLLDEPANALDLAHQVSVMRLLAELCRKQAKSVVMVLHDLNLAQSVASHVLLLYGDGRWQAGNKAEILQPELLSACLGHPLEVVQHGRQRIFLPLQNDLLGMDDT